MAVLEKRELRQGYCLVLGITDGSLIKSVLRSSELYVVGIDPDRKRIAKLRRVYDDAGVYGRRLSLHVGEPVSFGLPPYAATVILSEDLSAAGFSSREQFLRQIHRSLRPYGGTACFSIPEPMVDGFAKMVTGSNLANLKLENMGSLVLLTRAGALPGSADWTHEYADAANSVVSMDDLVKAPLGLLWFGGSSNAKILPRHGRGPSPQVCGGRLFIEGPDILRANDVYTGRVLWEKDLPGIGKFFDNTIKNPGASSIGGNYVSLEDAVYVVFRGKILRLDPQTGETVSEFAIPAEPGAPAAGISHIAASEDFLVAGVSPMRFASDYEFYFYNNIRGEKTKLKQIAEWMKASENDGGASKEAGEIDKRHVLKELNRLLYQETLGDKLPDSLLDKTPWKAAESRKEAAEIREQIAEHLKLGKERPPADPVLLKLNRRLIEIYFDIEPKRYDFGLKGVWGGTASRSLAVMNRLSGKILWTRDADNAFIHNAIAIGAGKVFCIDRLPMGPLGSMKRRGLTPENDFRLLALDARTGKIVWQTTESVLATWLGYSEEHDILLQAGRYSRGMLLPEARRWMAAYQGEDGRLIWKKRITHSGPCMLVGGTIYQNAAASKGSALSLLTGKTKRREHPLTGADVLWEYDRRYGCGNSVAGKNLLLFRSGAAGYYDLTNNGGTANLGGFKSGCTANLIVANGVLNAPDYTKTCTCSYQNQCSLALIHMPDVEVWTTNRIEPGKGPIKRVGLNFGAPGDHMADNGTLWLDYPNVGGPSPEVRVETVPENPEWFRHHSSTVVGGDLRWVAASGGKGLRAVRIALGNEAARPYTVRLVFAEFELGKTGGRVLDIALQGKTVSSDFDILRQAGEIASSVVLEFKSVEAADTLEIELTPAGGSPTGTPLICGVEAIAEEE